MRKFLTAALVLGLASPMPAQARDVLRLKPSSQWFLDYAEDSCRLARKFGAGDQQVTMFLDQFEPGDLFHMILGGEVLQPNRDRRPHKIMLRFGPHESEYEALVDTGTMDEKRALFVSGQLRIAAMSDAEKAASKEAQEREQSFVPAPLGRAREAAVKQIELTKGLRWDLALETGPLDKPLDALRNCAWDTVRLWGLDVEQQKTLSRRAYPKRTSRNWFSADDYPDQMARGGYEANVNVRLIIDEAGQPKSCNIQSSTRPKDFDDAVCKALIMRARFEPALDARGKPVPSFWRHTIRFRLES